MTAAPKAASALGGLVALLIVATFVPAASAQEFVSGTVGVVNPADGTMLPSGAVVTSGEVVALRGTGFAPGGEASIYLDNIKASRIAVAPVDASGGFQATFRMPAVPPGSHKFWVMEAKPGPVPPTQFVQATIAIRLQAAAR